MPKTVADIIEETYPNISVHFARNDSEIIGPIQRPEYVKSDEYELSDEQATEMYRQLTLLRLESNIKSLKSSARIREEGSFIKLITDGELADDFLSNPKNVEYLKEIGYEYVPQLDPVEFREFIYNLAVARDRKIKASHPYNPSLQT